MWFKVKKENLNKWKTNIFFLIFVSEQIRSSRPISHAPNRRVNFCARVLQREMELWPRAENQTEMSLHSTILRGWRKKPREKDCSWTMSTVRETNDDAGGSTRDVEESEKARGIETEIRNLSRIKRKNTTEEKEVREFFFILNAKFFFQTKCCSQHIAHIQRVTEKKFVYLLKKNRKKKRRQA